MRSLRFPNAALLPRKHEGGKRKRRHLLYGKKPNVYRVIYEVDEKLQTVWVLTIRHGARRKGKASELV
jgi:mRNA-degrading endonuclease RelE of RelBE toxin-antitoxin system